MFEVMKNKADNFNAVTLSPSVNSGQASSKCDNYDDVSLRSVNCRTQTDKYSILTQSFKIIFIVFFLLADFCFAKEINESMKQAGEYYRNGEFNKSIEIYEQLISEGYEGTSLYYNLANSYYRVGKLGYAILNYERALKISPSDEDAKHNLAFANLSSVDRIQPLPEFFLFKWWESLLASFTINGWTYISYFIFLVLIISVVLYFFARSISQQKIILFSGLGILVILLLVVSLLIVKINREENLISGVIVEQSVTVKTSPDTKSTDAFVIHEGLKVNLEDHIDNWIKIRLADGKVGWVEKDDVERI